MMNTKLIIRICNLSKDLRFDELRKVLESYGKVYVEMVRQIVESEAKNDEDAE